MVELESLVEVLTTVCNENGIAVIAVSAAGNISYWSASARTLFGYAPEEILRKPIANLAPHAACLLAEVIDAAGSGAFPKPIELHADRTDGEPLSLRLRAIPAGAPGEGCVITARA